MKRNKKTVLSILGATAIGGGVITAAVAQACSTQDNGGNINQDALRLAVEGLQNYNRDNTTDVTPNISALVSFLTIGISVTSIQTIAIEPDSGFAIDTAIELVFDETSSSYTVNINNARVTVDAFVDNGSGGTEPTVFDNDVSTVNNPLFNQVTIENVVLANGIIQITSENGINGLSVSQSEEARTLALAVRELATYDSGDSITQLADALIAQIQIAASVDAQATIAGIRFDVNQVFVGSSNSSGTPREIIEIFSNVEFFYNNNSATEIYTSDYDVSVGIISDPFTLQEVVLDSNGNGITSIGSVDNFARNANAESQYAVLNNVLNATAVPASGPELEIWNAIGVSIVNSTSVPPGSLASTTLGSFSLFQGIEYSPAPASSLPVRARVSITSALNFLQLSYDLNSGATEIITNTSPIVIDFTFSGGAVTDVIVSTGNISYVDVERGSLITEINSAFNNYDPNNAENLNVFAASLLNLANGNRSAPAISPTGGVIGDTPPFEQINAINSFADITEAALVDTDTYQISISDFSFSAISSIYPDYQRDFFITNDSGTNLLVIEVGVSLNGDGTVTINSISIVNDSQDPLSTIANLGSGQISLDRTLELFDAFQLPFEDRTGTAWTYESNSIDFGTNVVNNTIPIATASITTFANAVTSFTNRTQNSNITEFIRGSILFDISLSTLISERSATGFIRDDFFYDPSSRLGRITFAPNFFHLPGFSLGWDYNNNGAATIWSFLADVTLFFSIAGDSDDLNSQFILFQDQNSA